MRIDQYLVEKNITSSRTRGLNLIKLGGVKVNGIVIEKASYDVKENDIIEVDDIIGYASLGGLKLAEAIRKFAIKDLGICVDLGASNGGFTDVLLKNGAEKVYAVDVGECALPSELKNDSRVAVMDKTNAKNVPLESGTADFITADLSFISITKILPEISRLLKISGRAILLIKPQFEVGKKNLTKTGIVKSQKISAKCVEEIIQIAKTYCLEKLGLTPVPKLFENKNVEYLVYFIKKD